MRKDCLMGEKVPNVLPRVVYGLLVDPIHYALSPEYENSNELGTTITMYIWLRERATSPRDGS